MFAVPPGPSRVPAEPGRSAASQAPDNFSAMGRRRIAIGFAVVLAGFALANVYSFETMRPPQGCDDCFGSFGFPLPLGEFGGFAGQTHYFVSGIVGDIVIGLVASAFLGWALARAMP